MKPVHDENLNLKWPLQQMMNRGRQEERSWLEGY